MKEIEAIVNEVKAALALKKKEIELSGNAIGYTTQEFKNREMEFFAFEANIKVKTRQPYIAAEMIDQCKHDALELMAEISKIKAA
ncbi:hypothetical protein [Mucilaginibacter psychrotolerans]|uniref:Uncharacterized protein n=1 Tax=Mucilaginibacter psychrotolerans TaxID=1524096 RepID=A0A4Y8SFS4_9SPHI|nr:hypothetical protein [Mucilaginibacter psychrotolerans]TFF37495.1 hypothetical protein E2R66_11860 [Mucilaginibacter psychrotolerans]